MQLDSLTVIGIIAPIMTIIVGVIASLWYYTNLWCRLAIDFDLSACYHQRASSATFRSIPERVPLPQDSTGFWVKFILKAKSKKGTSIYSIQHEVRIGRMWTKTGRKNFQEVKTLNGFGIIPFNEYFALQKKLIDTPTLNCRLVLYHTHGVVKKTYKSSLAVK